MTDNTDLIRDYIRTFYLAPSHKLCINEELALNCYLNINKGNRKHEDNKISISYSAKKQLLSKIVSTHFHK